ncbi:hypothetical protein PAT3040_01732 [Paenibacillus agaridevorans]|jgi:hypothetical protein|uniref:Uncharacterized protein n=1 Tax=Paenibacillus agaridevorans TaxID=171404 RepID=A0A2R5EUY5_9BACL|nr:hypothetical protein [Paenibacillus agaridevorans]GBG07184.1 hypothetical protein PAT3040_01732 [Paenibacillus agaridevorans]
MLELLLLVIGCYAAAALLVHLAYRFGGERKKLRKHYVLIADGRQPHLEWYLRSVHSFSSWTGSDIRLTVFDRGMTDESKAIIDRWNRESHSVGMLRTDTGEASGVTDGKSYSSSGDGAVHLLWLLQSRGIVSERDYPVLVDLQNPEDLSKMPF